jgi:hypothetical protein
MRRSSVLLFGPFRAGDDWETCSVGCTHGYSHRSPPANHGNTHDASRHLFCSRIATPFGHRAGNSRGAERCHPTRVALTPIGCLLSDQKRDLVTARRGKVHEFGSQPARGEIRKPSNLVGRFVGGAGGDNAVHAPPQWPICRLSSIFHALAAGATVRQWFD